MYNFGLIGNCQISALVTSSGSVEWLCMPRLDSEPVFGRLLDPDGGSLKTEPVSYSSSSQRYRKNTNILETVFYEGDEDLVAITDFCPRFEQHGRTYRPAAMFRIIEPRRGGVRLRIECDPVQGWSKEPASMRRGNSHLRYVAKDGFLRLVTNVPLTYLISGEPFLLQEPAYVALLWDLPLEADLKQVALDFLERTERYWVTWVKHCSIPTMFQDEVIRSALALKLHCYEDTGAIIAATTTSLPEKLGGVRNWDYRLCWIRDAVFTLNALHQLGHFDEMEGFLRFILNIVNYRDNLLPVYGIDRRIPLPEIEHESWAGYLGSRPVRTQNAAAAQVQNDVYGELMLSLIPIYQDERFHHLRSSDLDKTMHWLAVKCSDVVGKKDSGIWEIRGLQLEHSFTNLMSWAGLDRWINLLLQRKISKPSDLVVEQAEKSKILAIKRVHQAVVDGSVRNSPDDASFDASMLLMAPLRFPDSALTRSTVEAISRGLCVNPADSAEAPFLLYRYRRVDDFGTPEDPFIICSFWLAHALALEGRLHEGRSIISRTTGCATKLGLFAEHFGLSSNLQLGNFPQTYSHVGLVNAAFAASPSWRSVL
jgi:GH15 family glucan-1,4-alpha-glucosidase